jgi:hypothetical protein
VQCPAIAMTENVPSRRTKKAWSACPNCGMDLRPQANESKRPYLNCPFCDAPIMPSWWMRIPLLSLSLVLSFGVPALLGFVGVTLFFVGVLFWYPALIAAYVLFYTAVPAKYMRRRETFSGLNLFHR